MKKFEIDPAFLTSVSVTEIRRYSFGETEEGLMNALKYGTSWSSSSTKDHPEFSKLREQLGQEGYIAIERGWWNGDRVLKRFMLNGKTFKKNDQFMCGAAIKWVLEH